MRTTIELPDPLFHRAKLVAAQRRVSLKKLITESLESALSLNAPAPGRMTRPPIVLGTPKLIPGLSNREVSAIFDAGDMDKFQRE